MNLPDGLFPPYWIWTAHGLYAALLVYAMAGAPWRRLRDAAQLNVFLGACVALMVLWSIRAGVAPGLNFHLLGATLLVLMFGWRFALIGQGAVLIAVTLSGKSGVQALSLNALLTTVVPVFVSQLVHGAAVRFLPRHFFVYVFVNGFFNAGIAMACTGVLASVAFLAGGVYTWSHLVDQYLPFFLLMIFPEAVLTGSAIAMMVVYRPEWVGTFDDEDYIRHK